MALHATNQPHQSSGEETVTSSPLWAAAREILQTFTKQKEKFGLNRTHVAKLRMSGEKENSVSSCAPPLFGHMENPSECGQSRKTLFFQLHQRLSGHFTDESEQDLQTGGIKKRCHCRRRTREPSMSCSPSYMDTGWSLEQTAAERRLLPYPHQTSSLTGMKPAE